MTLIEAFCFESFVRGAGAGCRASGALPRTRNGAVSALVSARARTLVCCQIPLASAQKQEIQHKEREGKSSKRRERVARERKTHLTPAVRELTVQQALPKWPRRWLESTALGFGAVRAACTHGNIGHVSPALLPSHPRLNVRTSPLAHRDCVPSAPLPALLLPWTCADPAAYWLCDWDRLLDADTDADPLLVPSVLGSPLPFHGEGAPLGAGPWRGVLAFQLPFAAGGGGGTTCARTVCVRAPRSRRSSVAGCV